MNAAASVRATEVAQHYDPDQPHIRPNGEKGIRALLDQGLVYQAAAENLSLGRTSASDVVNGWVNSSNHYINMTSEKYTKMGMACATVSDDPQKFGTYWVLLLMN